MIIIIKHGSADKPSIKQPYQPWFWNAATKKYDKLFNRADHAHAETSTVELPVNGTVLERISFHTPPKPRMATLMKQCPHLEQLVIVQEGLGWAVYARHRPAGVNIAAVTSRSNGWTVTTLVNYFIAGNIEVDFTRKRRHECWTNQSKSRLIESILIGLPIQLTFAVGPERGKFKVIDGNQRLSAILEFMGCLKHCDRLVLAGLNLRTDLEGLNSLSMLNLKTSDLSNFLEQPVRVISLQNWQTEEFLANLRKRLNCQG